MRLACIHYLYRCSDSKAGAFFVSDSNVKPFFVSDSVTSNLQLCLESKLSSTLPRNEVASVLTQKSARGSRLRRRSPAGIVRQPSSSQSHTRTISRDSASHVGSLQGVLYSSSSAFSSRNRQSREACITRSAPLFFRNFTTQIGCVLICFLRSVTVMFMIILYSSSVSNSGPTPGYRRLACGQ